MYSILHMKRIGLIYGFHITNNSTNPMLQCLYAQVMEGDFSGGAFCTNLYCTSSCSENLEYVHAGGHMSRL